MVLVFPEQRKERKMPTNTGRTHFKEGVRASPRTEFKKGGRPWNFGKKNPKFSGANNPNWKGGVYPEHLLIRHSSEMKRWRREVFERDKFTCVSCGRSRKPGDRVVLHAHHIKSFAKFPEFRFEVSNGETLCTKCHKDTETYGVNLKK
jgi:hypothetical protein